MNTEQKLIQIYTKTVKIWNSIWTDENEIKLNAEYIIVYKLMFKAVKDLMKMKICQ